MTAPANDQGRAALLGWQQTINSAWLERAGQTGLGGPNADAARKRFFDGPVPPLAQRKILRTGATVPGGKDGIILNRLYIADKDAAAYQLYGDGRGPSTDPNASSRVDIAWDTRTGEVSITVHPSTVQPTSIFQEQSPFTEPREVAPWPIKTGPGSLGTNFSNNFEVSERPGGIDVKYDLINSGLPDPVRFGAVQGQTSLSVTGNEITGDAHGEDYPDREVVQYRDDGSRLLNNRPMGPGGQWGTPIFGTDYDTPRGTWRAPR
jgi:hypothetical protein